MAVRLTLLLLGLLLGFGLGRALETFGFGSSGSAVTNTVFLMIAGVLLAYLLGPRIERALGTLAEALGARFSALQPHRVAAATVGLVVALLLSVLLSSVLSAVPFYTWYFNVVVTIVLAVFFVYFALQNAAAFSGLGWTSAPKKRAVTNVKVLDTNVIIDGRIVDLAQAGFVEGEIVVPSFVLRELQLLADHGDAQRRTRGKRGLTVLEELRATVPVRLHEWNAEPGVAVDDALVRFTREVGGKLVTNDGNLSKVAGLYGLKVLSIHEAATALRPKLQAGETLDVTVTKAGQQAGQGVAYLEDGTMIVVEDGIKHKGKTVRVSVLSAVQTNLGRMVFAKTVGE